MTGRDGGRRWELSRDDDDPDGSVHWISGPEPPLPRLLCPAWLLEGSRLQVQGRVRACGRDALDVVMTRRPSQRDGPVAADDPSAPLRVLVDAELGILLRIAEPGWEPEVTELVSADFDPVIDPGRFAPPPGSRIAEGQPQRRRLFRCRHPGRNVVHRARYLAPDRAVLILDERVNGAFDPLRPLDRGAAGHVGWIVGIGQCDWHVVSEEDPAADDHGRAFVEVQLLRDIGWRADPGYFGDGLAG